MAHSSHREPSPPPRRDEAEKAYSRRRYRDEEDDRSNREDRGKERYVGRERGHEHERDRTGRGYDAGRKRQGSPVNGREERHENGKRQSVHGRDEEPAGRDGDMERRRRLRDDDEKRDRDDEVRMRGVDEGRYRSRGGHGGLEEGRDRKRGRYEDRERDAGWRSHKDTEVDRDRGKDREERNSYRERDRDRRPGPSGRARSPSPRISRQHLPNRGSPPPPARRPSRSRSKSKSVDPEDKLKPNFKPSGLLAAETKTVKLADGSSTVLKYHEPPEARKPIVEWRLYVFKGSEQTDMLHIHRQSAYLLGRDRIVSDIPVDHPSCSKQHAVIQYRQVTEKQEFGPAKLVIKPFIIDLESTNGTHVNGETIPPARYYELQVNDVIKFGQSAREYVLLNDTV